MTETKSSLDTTRTSTPQQTETSPLKQNDTKQNWVSRLFWNSVNENEQRSLKVIVLNFLVFTVVVTVALFVQIYYGDFEVKPHGSVSSDSYECSEIGIDILKKGGNAVDAAIASTMCLGVVNFHITGLGGGGHMMIYNHKNREVLDIIDFRAAVPYSYKDQHKDISIEGLTVGVPGQLMGLWEAHQKFGKLPWKDLTMPASNLAKYGFKVNQNVISAGMHLNRKSRNNENLARFFNSLKEGENITFPKLAATLELIALTGAQALYNGSLAMDIVYSVKQAKGKMTLTDLSQYQISHSELLHTKFGNFDILAPGSSSGGALLLNALDNIQFLDLTAGDDLPSIILKVSDILHKTYVSFLEKSDALPSKSEPAASQVSAIDSEELYVVVVSGLNTWLGSQILTGAGFILNNAIVNGGVSADGKPLCYSTPVIALESGELCGKRLVLGSGDATIAAQVLTNALILKNNVTSSIESPRFFIDNIPKHIRVEDLHTPFYNPLVIKKLRQFLKIDRILLPYKSINIIEKNGDRVTTHSDSRGGGLPSEFK